DALVLRLDVFNGHLAAGRAGRTALELIGGQRLHHLGEVVLAQLGAERVRGGGRGRRIAGVGRGGGPAVAARGQGGGHGEAEHKGGRSHSSGPAEVESPILCVRRPAGARASVAGAGRRGRRRIGHRRGAADLA